MLPRGPRFPGSAISATVWLYSIQLWCIQLRSVKPKRRYQSEKRQAQARQTRTGILEAAHREFVANGWERTTIAAIAAGAGVSPETVYAAFSNKRTILRDLVRATTRGAEPDVPLIDQERQRAVREEIDPRQQIALFAASVTDVLKRIAPLMDVIRIAAASDSELAELHAELHRGRHRNLGRFAASLAAHGPLAAGIDEQTATDQIWRLASPELFLLMTRVERLSAEQFAVWLENTLAVLLLPKR